MPLSFQELLAQAKGQITELSVHELQRLREGDAAPRVIDVREPEEVAGGLIPGASACPRGLLELRIESLVPDRSTPIALVCAGGTRSALATYTLQTLGYQEVVSVAGGIGAWTGAGLPLEKPRGMGPTQRARYARQMVLPQIGERGQEALMNAKVLCVGAGGLGCPATLYLAAAGVGTIGVVDDDLADLSNLQRQILHGEDMIGIPKVDSARRALGRINSDITIVPYNVRLDATNALEIFAGYDVIVDGTDNFATRYLINDACVLLGLPNVHGSVFHFDGQVTVLNSADDGPCYRCLYPEPPPPELTPNCAQAGVLGAICGMIGSLQAAETVKLIVNAGKPLSGRILTVDALNMTVRELHTPRDPGCPICGDQPTITTLTEGERHCSRAR